MVACDRVVGCRCHWRKAFDSARRLHRARTRDPVYWQPTASILYDTPVGPAYDGAGLMITPLVMARADEVIE